MLSDKHRIKIKNSVVIVVGQVENEDSVCRLLKQFDIADKTPTECFDFVRSLKNLLKK